MHYYAQYLLSEMYFTGFLIVMIKSYINLRLTELPKKVIK